MTLNQIRYFCLAAQLHSITKAAQALYVTQPAISIAVRELEKEFSITLFYNRKGRLTLTEEGEEFYAKASELLQHSEDFKARFSDSRRVRPILRLGIPPMLSTVFFPDLLFAMQEAHPDIRLQLWEYGSARACDLVQDELLDAALVNMEMYKIDKFMSNVLTVQSLVFCVSADHPLASSGRTSVDIEELAELPLILFNSDSVQNQLLQDRFRAAGKLPNIRMYSSQMPTTLDLVRRGGCGCFLFQCMTGRYPELASFPLEPELSVRVGFVWKRGKYLPADLQTLIQFSEEYYQSHALE